MNISNCYLLLDLFVDPAETDLSALTQLLSKKRVEWNKKRNRPKGMKYQSLSESYDEILSQLSNADVREKQASEAREKKLDELCQLTKIIAPNRYLEQSHVDKLIERFKNYLREETILKTIRANCKSIIPSNNASAPSPPEFTDYYPLVHLKNLSSDLEILDASSIYDALGLQSFSSLSALRNAAEELLVKAQRSISKTAVVNAQQELAGIARQIFSSTESRKRFDESWKIFQIERQLHSTFRLRIDQNVVSPDNFAASVDEVVNMGFSRKDALWYVYDFYSKQSRILGNVDNPSKASNSVVPEPKERVDVQIEERVVSKLVCPSCFQLNDEDADECEHCHYSLRMVCPECGTKNLGITKCTKCGYKLPKNGNPELLLEECQKAIASGVFERASNAYFRLKTVSNSEEQLIQLALAISTLRAQLAIDSGRTFSNLGQMGKAQKELEHFVFDGQSSPSAQEMKTELTQTLERKNLFERRLTSCKKQVTEGRIFRAREILESLLLEDSSNQILLDLKTKVDQEINNASSKLKAALLIENPELRQQRLERLKDRYPDYIEIQNKLRDLPVERIDYAIACIKKAILDKDVVQAKKSLETLCSLDPNEPQLDKLENKVLRLSIEVVYEQARRDLLRGRFLDAKTCCEQLLLEHPDDPYAQNVVESLRQEISASAERQEELALFDEHIQVGRLTEAAQELTKLQTSGCSAELVEPRQILLQKAQRKLDRSLAKVLTIYNLGEREQNLRELLIQYPDSEVVSQEITKIQAPEIKRYTTIFKKALEENDLEKAGKALASIEELDAINSRSLQEKKRKYNEVKAEILFPQIMSAIDEGNLEEAQQLAVNLIGASTRLKQLNAQFNKRLEQEKQTINACVEIESLMENNRFYQALELLKSALTVAPRNKKLLEFNREVATSIDNVEKQFRKVRDVQNVEKRRLKIDQLFEKYPDFPLIQKEYDALAEAIQIAKLDELRQAIAEQNFDKAFSLCASFEDAQEIAELAKKLNEAYSAFLFEEASATGDDGDLSAIRANLEKISLLEIQTDRTRQYRDMLQARLEKEETYARLILESKHSLELNAHQDAERILGEAMGLFLSRPDALELKAKIVQLVEASVRDLQAIDAIDDPERQKKELLAATLIYPNLKDQIERRLEKIDQRTKRKIVKQFNSAVKNNDLDAALASYDLLQSLSLPVEELEQFNDKLRDLNASLVFADIEKAWKEGRDEDAAISCELLSYDGKDSPLISSFRTRYAEKLERDRRVDELYREYQDEFVSSRFYTAEQKLEEIDRLNPNRIDLTNDKREVKKELDKIKKELKNARQPSNLEERQKRLEALQALYPDFPKIQQALDEIPQQKAQIFLANLKQALNQDRLPQALEAHSQLLELSESTSIKLPAATLDKLRDLYARDAFEKIEAEFVSLADVDENQLAARLFFDDSVTPTIKKYKAAIAQRCKIGRQISSLLGEYDALCDVRRYAEAEKALDRALSLGVQCPELDARQEGRQRRREEFERLFETARKLDWLDEREKALRSLTDDYPDFSKIQEELDRISRERVHTLEADFELALLQGSFEKANDARIGITTLDPENEVVRRNMDELRVLYARDAYNRAVDDLREQRLSPSELDLSLFSFDEKEIPAVAEMRQNFARLLENYQKALETLDAARALVSQRRYQEASRLVANVKALAPNEPNLSALEDELEEKLAFCRQRLAEIGALESVDQQNEELNALRAAYPDVAEARLAFDALRDQKLQKAEDALRAALDANSFERALPLYNALKNESDDVSPEWKALFKRFVDVRAAHYFNRAMQAFDAGNFDIANRASALLTAEDATSPLAEQLRVIVAKRSAQEKQIEALVAQLIEAFSARRYFTAKRAIDEALQIVPNRTRLVTFQQEVQKKIAKIKISLEQVLESSDSLIKEKNLLILLEHYPDSVEIPKALEQLPPSPPEQAEALEAENGIKISWSKSAVPFQTEYTVYRERFTNGRFIPNGIVRNSTTELSCVDRNCVPFSAYRYRIEAKRNGLSSISTTLTNEIVLSGHIKDFEYKTVNKQIEASWSLPVGFDEIEVVRREAGQPDVPLSKDQVSDRGFVDEDALSGVQYEYAIKVRYCADYASPGLWTEPQTFAAKIEEEQADEKPGWLKSFRKLIGK